MREIVVLRDGAAQSRKVSKGGVGGERQHGENGADRNVVENTAARDGREQYRKNALVAGLAGIGGLDAIGMNQKCDAGQHHDEQRDDDGQGAARHGHGSAAAGESLHDEPCAGRRRGRQTFRKSFNRYRVASRSQSLEQPNGNGRKQGDDKHVGGHHEDGARIPRATEVDQRNQNQNPNAKTQSVPLQAGYGRDKRSHTGRNADRDDEHVIDHESGSG